MDKSLVSKCVTDQAAKSSMENFEYVGESYSAQQHASDREAALYLQDIDF